MHAGCGCCCQCWQHLNSPKGLADDTCGCCCCPIIAAVVCAQIQEVVLVEVQDAKVSHAGIARVVSSSWGGDASVTVLTVTSRGLAPASLP